MLSNNSISHNEDWKLAPLSVPKSYYYEGSNMATTWDLPDNYCFVQTYRQTVNRGIAIAYHWAYNTNHPQNSFWINQLFENWKGWVKMGDALTLSTLTSLDNSFQYDYQGFKSVPLSTTAQTVATSSISLTAGKWLIGGSFYWNFGANEGIRMYAKTQDSAATLATSIGIQPVAGCGATMNFLRLLVLSDTNTNYINKKVIWTIQRELGSSSATTSNDSSISYGYLIRLK